MQVHTQCDFLKKPEIVVLDGIAFKFSIFEKDVDRSLLLSEAVGCKGEMKECIKPKKILVYKSLYINTASTMLAPVVNHTNVLVKYIITISTFI